MSLARKNWLLPAQNYTRRVLKTTLNFVYAMDENFVAHTHEKSIKEPKKLDLYIKKIPKIFPDSTHDRTRFKFEGYFN